MNQGDAYRLEERIFGEALLKPVAEREIFLASTCGGDTTLRERVEALLREHEHSANALDLSPGRELINAGVMTPGAEAADQALVSRVGHYLLGEKLGEGGWGAVYAAEQLRPVRRSVAIKIIKLGMDTRAVVARFQAEQQALAMMEHPGIARVFDAGATETGRPFFVMELVRGTRITEFCDVHRLTVSERLRLFVQVCDAVQHAHQKGVIHRDLKPSNILVSGDSSAPGVKVIDFGIAKATQGRLGEETVFTAVDALVGTPAYMSPEQAANQRGDIDTRSDIYSLGVLLYELLTGTTPLEARELREAAPEETRRRILEAEVSRPSARVRALPVAVRGHTAACRQLSGAKLPDLIAGDLDWVVLRCLEKDRARRYDSASALARDIEHSLASEPVTARPPSRTYELGKFVRKHRVAFAAAAAIALMLVIGATISTVMFFREKAALDRAVAAEYEQSRLREEAQSAAKEARTEAARSKQVAQFTATILEGTGPSVAQGSDTKLMREIMDRAAKRLDSELPGQPDIEADLRSIVGRVYHDLREIAASEAMYRRVLALRRESLGADHPKVADALNAVGKALGWQTRLVEAEPLHREALAIQTRAYGEEHLALVDTLIQLSGVTTSRRDYEQSKSLYLRAAAILSKHFPSDDPAHASVQYSLARLLWSSRQYPAAEQAYRDLLVRYPDGAASNPPVSGQELWSGLASSLWVMDKFPQAEAAYRRAIELQRQKHAVNPEALSRLALVLFEQDKFNESADQLAEAISINRQMVARDPANSRFLGALGEALNLSGACAYYQGRFSEAEPLLVEASPLVRHIKDRTVTLEPTFLLGSVLVRLGRDDEAEVKLREAVGFSARALRYYVYDLLREYHQLLLRRGKAESAAAMWREQTEVGRSIVKARGEAAVTTFTVSFMQALASNGAPGLAEQRAREHLAWWDKTDANSWAAHAFRSSLGLALLRQRRFAEAEPLLLASAAALEPQRATLPYRMGRNADFAVRYVEQLYLAWDRPAELAAWKARHDQAGAAIP